MIELTHGDLLAAPAEALVNAVNTVGVMGKGIALQFRKTYPDMFFAYEKACKEGAVRVGQMNVFDRGESHQHARWIINFPTKRHWREPSRLVDIESGLADLSAVIRRVQIHSVAIPPLGCGLGGLEWTVVQPLIESAMANLVNVKILIYSPNNPTRS